MDIRIYYEDTDCGGVVYYANYLKYFERGRTELLRSKGIDVGELAGKGQLFVVARAEVDYIYPAMYGDVISIETRVLDVHKAYFSVSYLITRKADSKKLVSGFTKMAFVGNNRRPARIREDILKELKKLSLDNKYC